MALVEHFNLLVWDLLTLFGGGEQFYNWLENDF